MLMMSRTLCKCKPGAVCGRKFCGCAVLYHLVSFAPMFRIRNRQPRNDSIHESSPVLATVTASVASSLRSSLQTSLP